MKHLKHFFLLLIIAVLGPGWAVAQTAAEAGKPAPPAAPAETAPASPASNPGTVMAKTVDSLRLQKAAPSKNYSYSGIATGSALADWLGDDTPTNACELTRWSRAPATGDMPLIWDSEAGRYEVPEKAWHEAPAAIQLYTWYFLRAYGHLPAPLRKSHSAAAVGTAAVIAADVVYPWIVAVLPDDVAVPATAMSLLNAGSPGLIEGVATGKPAKDLVSAALKRLCAVGDNESVSADLASADMLAAAPWERAAEGFPLKLSHLMPNHPLSLQRLDEAAQKISHLTLRLMAQAAVAQERFTLLPAGSTEMAGWKALAKESQKNVEAELSARGAATLAPAWTPGKSNFLKTAPQSLRPLAVILLAEASYQVFLEWEATGAAAAAAKLREHPAFQNLCALAGQTPDLKMAPKPELRGQTVFLGTMAFKNLVRGEPSPGVTPVMENVTVDLIAIPPTGDGEPIRGFSAEAFVLAKMPGAAPKWIQGAEVVTGMQVMGHVPMGDPAAGLTTRLDGKVRAEWFTVSKVRLYENVKGTVVIGHDSGWNLTVAVPQHLLLDVGKVGVWVEALKLDSGFNSFVGAGADGQPLEVSPIKTVQETDNPQRLVSLALTHESDELTAFANNVVVSGKAGGGGGCDTVECTSGDVSMVVETEELATKNGRTPLKNLVENPKCEPNPSATIAEAYLEKPPECPWDYAPYLKGEAYITLKSGGPLLRAISLVVEDANGIGRDFICSRNTKLRAVSENGSVVPRRAFNVKVGEQLVADFAPDGKTPKTIKVTRVQEIDLPDQRFISLVLANLKLSRCGPLVVEWEGRQEHMFNVGVAPASRLALSKPVSQPAATPALKASAAPVDSDTTTAPAVCVAGNVSADKAKGRKLAVYDPPLQVIGTSVLGETTGAVLTRMLVIKAGGSELRVAGSQSLLVQNKEGGFSGSKPAYRLASGDQIFVAKEGETTAKAFPVENVTPVFACGLGVIELCSGSTQGWHKNLPIRSDICLAENMATVTKVPGQRRPRPGITIRVPDDGQPGPSSGSFNGERGGKSPERKPAGGGSVAELNTQPGDLLELSEEAREQFKQRARMISQAMDGELAQVRSVSRGGRLQVLEEALKPGKWPYGEAPEKLSGELRGWVAQALQRRGAFLAAPDWKRLPEVCLQDVTLAAWLDAAGCPETARLFARDAIEFSLFAGCSEKAAKRPEVNASSGLGLILAASKWVAPSKGDSTAYSVNPIATRELTSWAAGLRTQDLAGKPLRIEPPVPKDGIVELDELFEIWAIRAEQANVSWPDYNNPKDPGRADFMEWLSQNGPQAPAATGDGAKQ